MYFHRLDTPLFISCSFPQSLHLRLSILASCFCAAFCHRLCDLDRPLRAISQLGFLTTAFTSSYNVITRSCLVMTSLVLQKSTSIVKSSFLVCNHLRLVTSSRIPIIIPSPSIDSSSVSFSHVRTSLRRSDRKVSNNSHKKPVSHLKK